MSWVGCDVAINWFLSWLERWRGEGRALGGGEVKFTSQSFQTQRNYIFNQFKTCDYEKVVMGIADAKMQVDERVIYEANDLKLFI